MLSRRLPYAIALCLSFLCAVSITCAKDIDRTESRPIAPGVEFLTQRQIAGPWEIRAIKIDRSSTPIRLQGALAAGELPTVDTLTHIIEHYEASGETTVAATNADFFVMAGNPRAGNLCGLTICDGELVTLARGRPAFVIMADGTPRIGVFETTATVALPGGTLTLLGINRDMPDDGACLYTASWAWEDKGAGVLLKAEGLPIAANGEWKATVVRALPEDEACAADKGELILRGRGQAAAPLAALKPGDALTLTVKTDGLEAPVSTAVGGGPELLKGGQLLQDPEGTDPRHPRTLAGYNDREIIIVTVDGRQRGWSVGMKLGELGRLMQNLGCTEAINLDGGGSTTIWVRGSIENRPSDGGQRRIANGVLVKSSAPQGPLARITARPDTIVAMPGAAVPLRLWLTDDAYNPVTADVAKLQASVTEGSATAAWADGRLRVAGGVGPSTLTLSHPGSATARTAIPLQLVDTCPALELTPPSAYLCPGDEVTFQAEGLTEDGSTIWLPDGGANWALTGEGLQQVAPGRYRATAAGGQATISAQAGGATALAVAYVASEVPVEGFEGRSGAHFTTAPEGDVVTGNLAFPVDDAAEGKGYCRMQYNLGQPTGTRAAYIRLDRPIGTALKVSAMARGTGTPAAWLRVAVIDGNGSRLTVDLAEKLDWGQEWRRVETRLPEGLKQPLKLESVYVVATAGKTGQGTVEIDDIRAYAVPD